MPEEPAMLTEYETQKLLDQMKQELNASPGVAVKCAVMLLLLFVLAWIGSTGEQDLHSTPYASHISPVKERASRIVFEERRRHSDDMPSDFPGEVELAQGAGTPAADEGYRPVSASDRDVLNSPTKE
jgi:hypothetical protein